jgi:hypothetical protein
MKYVPMTDDEWAKLLGDDYPNGLYYGFYGQIEQAVLARIAEQGLVIVPKEAERVALIEGLDYALGHITHIPVSHELLRDIRAYLQGGA